MIRNQELSQTRGQMKAGKRSLASVALVSAVIFGMNTQVSFASENNGSKFGSKVSKNAPVRGPIEMMVGDGAANLIFPEDAGARGPIARSSGVSRSVNLNAVGPAGETGPAGASGPQGPVGQQGPRGLIGPTGVPGQDGRDGAPGQAGRDGAPGQAGRDGEVGAQGLAGINGLDGTNGIDGRDGTDGINGNDGIDGKDGLSACAAWNNNEECDSAAKRTAFINYLIAQLNVDLKPIVTGITAGNLTCPNNQNITTIILTDNGDGTSALSVQCKDPSGNSGSNTPANQGEGFDEPTNDDDNSDKTPPGQGKK
jgi:hypothetical protein